MSDNRCTYCLREGHRASHCPNREAASLLASDLRHFLSLCIGACAFGALALLVGHAVGWIK